MKRLGLYLGVIGVVIVIFAMNMDITAPYSDVVNLGLISERQNYLIMGGFAFLAGVVMFASAKIKETPEEEAESRRVSQEKKLQLEAMSKKNAEGIREWFARRENKGLRLFILVFTYWIVMGYANMVWFNLTMSLNGVGLFRIIVLFLLVANVMRSVSASTVAKQSALFVIGLAVIDLVYALSKYLGIDNEYATSLVIFNVFTIMVSIFIYWVAGKGKKK